MDRNRHYTNEDIRNAVINSILKRHEKAKILGVCPDTVTNCKNGDNTTKLFKNFRKNPEKILSLLQVSTNQPSNAPPFTREKEIFISPSFNNQIQHPISVDKRDLQGDSTRQHSSDNDYQYQDANPLQVLTAQPSNAPPSTREEYMFKDLPLRNQIKHKNFMDKKDLQGDSAGQKSKKDDRQHQDAKTEFSFSKDRRVKTFYNKEVDSHFYDYLKNPKQKQDLSYTDLYLIAEKLGLDKRKDDLEYQKAIETAIKNFYPEEIDIPLVEELNRDLQLLVHHILKFHSVNLNKLKDKPMNNNKNSFRQYEMELTKLLIKEKLLCDSKKILPPNPAEECEKKLNLQYAMAALIGLNRQIPNSVFDGETSKAVFSLSKKICKAAYRKAAESGKTERESRIYYNDAMFRKLDKNDFKGPGMKSCDYIEKNFGINLRESTEDNSGSFVASESDDGSFLDEKNTISDLIFRKNDKFIDAQNARKKYLNTLAVFSKFTCKKEIIDEYNEDNKRKYDRLHERISKLYSKINNDEKFKELCKELKGYKAREGNIEKVLASIEKELKILKYCADSQSGSSKIKEPEEKIEIDYGGPFYHEILAYFCDTDLSFESRLKDLSTKINLKGGVENRIEILQKQYSIASQLQKDLLNLYTDTPIEHFFTKDQKWLNDRKAIYERSRYFKRRTNNNETSGKKKIHSQGDKEENKTTDQNDIPKQSEDSEESPYEISENEGFISESEKDSEETNIEDEKDQSKEILENNRENFLFHLDGREEEKVDNANNLRGPNESNPNHISNFEDHLTRESSEDVLSGAHHESENGNGELSIQVNNLSRNQSPKGVKIKWNNKILTVKCGQLRDCKGNLDQIMHQAHPREPRGNEWNWKDIRINWYDKRLKRYQRLRFTAEELLEAEGDLNTLSRMAKQKRTVGHARNPRNSKRDKGGSKDRLSGKNKK